jgi:hypothetical protein
MTEIVTTFLREHRFQYVERRYSGFVALTSVAGRRYLSLAILGINELKRCKNFGQRTQESLNQSIEALNPAD